MSGASSMLAVNPVDDAKPAPFVAVSVPW